MGRSFSSGLVTTKFQSDPFILWMDKPRSRAGKILPRHPQGGGVDLGLELSSFSSTHCPAPEPPSVCTLAEAKWSQTPRPVAGAPWGGHPVIISTPLGGAFEGTPSGRSTSFAALGHQPAQQRNSAGTQLVCPPPATPRPVPRQELPPTSLGAPGLNLGCPADPSLWQPRD